MKPKFKVGDKVRVSFQSENQKYRLGVSTEMKLLKGDMLTISCISTEVEKDKKEEVPTDGYVYCVEENTWTWSSAMLELVTCNKETMEKTLTLSLSKAREIFNKDNCSEDMKEFLLSNFTEEELTKKKLPTSWEEFCSKYPRKGEEYWINDASEIEGVEYDSDHRDSKEDRNLLPNEKTAKAVLALCQLIQLRDYYNDGWKPDWSNAAEFKYTIEYVKDTIIPSTTWNLSRILAFKSSELRDKFFDNFKDLIEQAKELI